MPETDPAKDIDKWEDAIAQANCWRGDCLQSFAQSEMAVTETLLVLNAVEERGNSVKLPHLIGQRFEALKLATGPDGAFANEGAKAHEAISAFLVREQLRAFLCHGIAKVVLERSGSWIAIFNLTTLRNQKCDRTQLVVTQVDANRMLQDIKQSGAKLGTALGNLRKQFSS
jgi:hypothetical protein